MMRNLQPAGHRVLVKLITPKDEVEEVSESGIVLAIKDKRTRNAEKYATQEAYVVSLGINAFKAFDNGDPWCKVGDKVLICKYSGENRDDIEDGQVYRLINDDDIHGIFVGEEL